MRNAGESATGAPGRITQLLFEWRKGDQASLERLTPLVYDELHRLAKSRMRRERNGHTLQVTGLVHEAYLRLIDQKASWESRGHFFAIASEIMRRILIDHAKGKHAAKRGDGLSPVSLDDQSLPAANLDSNLLLVDEALTRLQTFDQVAAAVVQMRFFAGLTNEEISAALGISTATVQRHWKMAKAWIYHELAASPHP